MSDCNCNCATPGTYRFKKVSYGSPIPLHVNVRAYQNGMATILPKGYQFAPCQIALPEIPCCVETANSAAPTVDSSAQIPTSVFGNDDTLLARPTAGFKQINIDGVVVTVPDYSGDVSA